MFINSKKYLKLLESEKEQILRMAGVENLVIDEKSVKHENSVSAFFSGIEIFVPLTGLFDPKKLRESLLKEQAEIQKYVSSLKGKLENKSFVERAPRELVEGEKHKYDDALATLQKLTERLQSLSAS